jgi:hypothetical protein
MYGNLGLLKIIDKNEVFIDAPERLGAKNTDIP